MRGIDLSSWASVLTTLGGLALVTLIGVGVRLLMMFTVQQRRERMNRQINERLRTLIAAYKVLGGSFTGDLAVDPTHLRELRRREEPEAGAEAGAAAAAAAAGVLDLTLGSVAASDRTRRIRDAVEAALSDIILLGTEEQVGLAAEAARELVAARLVHTHALVVSLRDFVREALDLDPVPPALAIPAQGPARPGGSGGRGRGDGDRGGQGRSGGGGAGAAGMAGSMGMGLGMAGAPEETPPPDHRA